MKNKKTEANISMVVSKTFSGLNMNALKYLLPLWMSPMRVCGRGVLGDRLVYETGGFYDER